MVSTAQAIPFPSIQKQAPAIRRWTLEEYLRREEQAKERHEYYDGIIKALPMARGPHNLIAVNMTTNIQIQLKQLGKNYFVFNSNQKVFLPSLGYSLYPDALVVCEKPLYWDDNQVLLINPVLIVEVLSKSTKNYDRREKFGEYKTLTSFKEYVLIEQDECRVESRFREEPNLWRETIETDLSKSIFFPSIGCSLALSDVYHHIEFPAPKPQSWRKK